MTIRVKVGGIGGGSWRVVPEGAFRIEARTAVPAGQGWFRANKVWIKRGEIGGGFWHDTGYVGPPFPPQSFRVTSWDFSVVNTAWFAPAAGGAPVHHYEVLKQDQWGNTYGGYPLSVSGALGTTFPFVVSPDDRLQLFVRSVSAAGVVSDWAGPIRVQIGHTQILTPYLETTTQAWASPVVGVNLYNGASAGPTVPSNVEVWGMYVNLTGTVGYNPMSHPDSSPQRDILFVAQGQVVQTGQLRGDGVLVLDNPSHGWLYISGNGANSGWGLYCVGSGWSSNGTSGNRAVGDLQVHGTETIQVTKYREDRARAENATW